MTTVDDIVSDAWSLNKALRNLASFDAKTNTFVHYALTLHACDELRREQHHGSEDLCVDFTFPLHEVKTLSRRITPTPNVANYFQQKAGTVFSVALTVSLDTLASVGVRNEYSFCGAPSGCDDDTLEIINALESDSSYISPDWTVYLKFDRVTKVLKEIELTHTPKNCPTLMALLEREATYIEEERLLSIIHATSAHRVSVVAETTTQAPPVTTAAEAESSSTDKKRKR